MYCDRMPSEGCFPKKTIARVIGFLIEDIANSEWRGVHAGDATVTAKPHPLRAQMYRQERSRTFRTLHVHLLRSSSSRSSALGVSTRKAPRHCARADCRYAHQRTRYMRYRTRCALMVLPWPACRWSAERCVLHDGARRDCVRLAVRAMLGPRKDEPPFGSRRAHG